MVGPSVRLAAEAALRAKAAPMARKITSNATPGTSTRPLKAHHVDDANPIPAVPSQRFSPRPQRLWLADWPARVNSSIAMGIKQGPGALRSGTSRTKPRIDLLDARRKTVRMPHADAAWRFPIG